MRRRHFVALAAGAAVAWPLAAQAQSRDGMRRLGVLMVGLARSGDSEAQAAALVQGLETLGWHDGANLSIDWRWTGGDPARFESDAADLVRSGPDVLVAAGSLSTMVLKRRTATIPIVFVHVTDPVGQGFAASLAHPGGNITGFSIYDPPMAGKWLEFLMRIAPPPGKVGVLYNPATTPYAGLFLSVLRGVAPSVAVTVEAVPVRDVAEIEATMMRLAGEGGGLLVLPNTFSQVHRDAIVGLAGRYRLPTVYPSRLFAAAGGLMSYGIDLSDLFRRAAAYVDRILKGANPGELPVQNPTKFALVINLKTAKALGVTIAPSLLAGADEVIE